MKLAKRRPPRARRAYSPRNRGLHYDPKFVTPADRQEIQSWLSTLYPIWEHRFSPHHPPPPGQMQRLLLRPVYWLGNWQFACLDYYRPPHGVRFRCVQAEPFPPVLARLIRKVEKIAHGLYRGADRPPKWHLNTCLVNFYGARLEDEKWIDTARVGEHRDFEPGPVASISLGERAIFQFVASRRPGERDAVVFQQWLEDSSLQIFGGDRWKRQLFHRVQRVDKRAGVFFPMNVENFRTRRINFTFRYVPDEHIYPYAALPAKDAGDVRAYMELLARHSAFFGEQLRAAGSAPSKHS